MAAENVDARPGDEFAEWVATSRAKYVGQDLRDGTPTYIPYSQLKKYWSISKINRVLRSYNRPLPFDAYSIQSAYLRIFSALVWTSTTRRFLGLILTDGLDDGRWPLVDPPPSWDVPNRGSEADFGNLKRNQWIFFPYRFEKHWLHKTRLNSDCILPIESIDTFFSSGESLLHKIKINDEYNGLTPESKGQFFALKAYELKYAEDRWHTEVEALTMLRQSPSENLVTFYGSFRKDGYGFIILDFANGGDLKEFFRNTPPPTALLEIQTFWKSLIGTLKGLDRIHQLMNIDSHMMETIQGIHQDIKPANIVLMKGSSGSPYDFQPKIADFGLFSHATKSGSNNDEARGPNKYGNQIFSAPEVSTNVRNKFKGISLITPGADIFSFGAVLSAAAAFVAGGQQLMQEYFVKRQAAHARLRRFSKTDFEGCFHAGTEKFPVIEEMHNHIKTICQDKRHDLITPKILDIVQQHMLLPKSSERDPAALLIDRFNNILWNEPPSPTISLSGRRGSPSLTDSDNGETLPRVSDGSSVADIHQMSTLDLNSTESQKMIMSNVSEYQTLSNVTTAHTTGVLSNSQPYPTSTMPSSFPSNSSNQYGASLNEDPKRTIQTVEELDDVSDDATIYTQNSSDSDSRDVQYQRDLADEIYRQVSSLTTNDEEIARIGECLERILQTFALKFAKEGEKEEYRVISKFLYRHRRKIAAQYCAKEVDVVHADAKNSQSSNESMITNEEQKPEIGDTSNLEMDSTEKTTRWLINVDTARPPDVAEDRVADTELASEDGHTPNLVRNSHAHKWLLAALARELNLAIPKPSATSELSEEIFKAMRKNRPFSRKSPLPSIDAKFSIEWSPHSFLEQQEYDAPPDEAVSKALVLVGTTEQVEGVSCCEYLFRNWPDTSQVFLELIQSIVRSPEGTQHDAKLEDGTKIQASVEKGVFNLTVSGFADTVIEIGEQVMWIGCALRESEPVKICYVYPTIENVLVLTTSAPKISLEIHLSVEFDISGKDEFHNGHCWTKMFQNPLVVTGFPIPRIRSSAPGLRLAFNTMMLLMPDSRLSTYRGNLFIKRFSMLLIALKQVGNIILWHAVSKDNGSYIYYHDPEVLKQKVEVDASILTKVDISNLTHIIGWTEQADNVTGTRRANLAIKGCGLRNKEWEFELERFNVGFSQHVAANISVKVGKRDRPILAPQNGDYHESIQFISQRFVVLYDVEDQRGFLLDGSSVLLHLVMASLDQEEKDDTLQLGTHGLIQFHEDTDPRIRAVKTLLADRNIRLRLYHRNDGEETKTEVTHARGGQDQPTTTTATEEIESRKGSWASFKDRVTRIYSLLDQGLNMNTDESAKVDLRQLIGYQKLEGYDFRDFACSNKAKLKVATLEGSEAWTDLVRGLPALTLFGRGFGELIRNGERGKDSSYLCRGWESVPTDQTYLSMSNSTLARILAHHGNSKTSELIRGLFVKCPRDLFEACSPNAPRCARTHVLVRGQDKKAPTMENLPENGAIIIGRDESRSISRFLGRKRSKVKQSGHLLTVLSTDSSNMAITTSPGTSVGPSFPRSDVSAGLSRPDTPRTSLDDDTIVKSRLSGTDPEPYSSAELRSSKPQFLDVSSANRESISAVLQLSSDAQRTSSAPQKQPVLGSDTVQKPQRSFMSFREWLREKHKLRWLFRRGK